MKSLSVLIAFLMLASVGLAQVPAPTFTDAAPSPAFQVSAPLPKGGPTQVVKAVPITESVAGSDVNVPIVYWVENVDPGNWQCSGVGFRLHYNGNVLAYQGFDLLAPNKAQYPQDRVEIGNRDGDAATNREVVCGWADWNPGTQWPWKEPPTTIVRLKFRAKTAGTSKLNLSLNVAQLQPGYQGRAENAVVTITSLLMAAPAARAVGPIAAPACPGPCPGGVCPVSQASPTPSECSGPGHYPASNRGVFRGGSLFLRGRRGITTAN